LLKSVREGGELRNELQRGWKEHAIEKTAINARKGAKRHTRAVPRGMDQGYVSEGTFWGSRFTQEKLQLNAQRMVGWVKCTGGN